MSQRGTQPFGLEPGDELADDYVISERLGGGWEGEVYKVRERRTGVFRAAKLFYLERNRRNRAARSYARKLDRLRNCPIVIQYHHSTKVEVDGREISCMISDYVAGELLSEYTRRQRGARLFPYAALHIIYPMAKGLEFIHELGEYHGDIHDDNVLVRQRGIFFDVSLVDFYYQGPSNARRRRQDLLDLIRLLYDLLGGARFYASQPPFIKSIVKGLRRDLIRESFPTVRHLRRYLETYAE
jgi:serine/threonine protein kinase